MRIKKLIGRLLLVFKADKELWYDTHANGLKVYKPLALSFYESEKFNSRVYSISILWLSFQFAWIKPPKENSDG